MNHTLDASAVLRYLDNEAGVGEIKRLLLDAYHQRTELFINAVNWSEIIYTCWKRGGAASQGKVRQLAALPVTLVAVEETMASLAANYRLSFKLHLADAFALATAAHTASALVTADYDFKQPKLPAPVNFLPRSKS